VASIDEPLCRSALYGVLSLSLHRPSQADLDYLRSRDTRVALMTAVSLMEPSAPGDASSDLAVRLNQWLRAVEALTLDAWQSGYTRTFGHTARGKVCPYETEYGQQGLFEQPRQLAKISGFYGAFGLELTHVGHERADHASCELEFLDFLCRKEAVAIEMNDEANREETQKGIRLFLRDHVGRFACAFARLLQKNDPGGFYGELGGLLLVFVTLECRRLDVRPGLPLLQLRPEDDDPAPMACGGQEELVQLKVPS
jgi:TorA maturation chaperone TorD